MVFIQFALRNHPVIFWTTLTVVVYILMYAFGKVEPKIKAWWFKDDHHNHHIPF